MSNIDFGAVGSLLYSLRDRSKMTQQEFATAMKVTKAAVSQWEKGSGIKTEMLYKIAKYYDITVKELISGRLNEESNADFWKRNYDLSNYDFFEPIDETNIDKVREFFNHCNMVIKRFYKLLPIWAEEKLTSEGEQEFEYLKRYFDFDTTYASYLKYHRPKYIEIFVGDMEKEFMKFQIQQLKSLPLNDYKWELSKYYSFNYDLKIELINQSSNMKALEYLLSVLNQPTKDRLLNYNLSHKVLDESSIGISKFQHIKNVDYTYDEIERIPFLKIMLNGGCNCMYSHRETKKLASPIDPEEFERLEGKVKIIEPINEDIGSSYYVNGGRVDSIKAINYWKKYSYKEYLDATDFAETNYLKSLVNNKNDNPLQYFEDMVMKYNN